ncbi:uncharacterized protein [Watersipora subatra]|uniref:uncharacterized protein n=1 Tax=Watersipora subatra TaxID=2589382 RepID=UPI00355B8CBD
MLERAGNGQLSAARQALGTVCIGLASGLLIAAVFMMLVMNGRIRSLEDALARQQRVQRSKRVFSRLGSTFPPIQSTPSLDNSMWSVPSSGDFFDNSLLDMQTEEPVSRQFLHSDIFRTLIAGTTYVRWGRVTCPQLSTQVYRGYIAGPRIAKGLAGSGSDLQCLPNNQVITGLFNSDQRTPNNISYTLLAAATYDRKDNSVPSNHKIGCSVCLIERRAQIMIPNGRFCPSGWLKEYDGILMIATSNRKPKVTVNHVCMDRNPAAGEAYSHSPSLEMIRVKTGECVSNSCRAIRNSKEVPCVVCSVTS